MKKIVGSIAVFAVVVVTAVGITTGIDFKGRSEKTPASWAVQDVTALEITTEYVKKTVKAETVTETASNKTDSPKDQKKFEFVAKGESKNRESVEITTEHNTGQQSTESQAASITETSKGIVKEITIETTTEITTETTHEPIITEELKPTEEVTEEPQSISATEEQQLKERIWHEPVTEQVWVVDREAWTETWEEPVTEYHDICSSCGAIIDGHAGEHLDGSWNRYLSGKIGMEEVCEGYRTGVAFYSTVTKTMEHPEEGHLETIIIEPGYWENYERN